MVNQPMQYIGERKSMNIYVVRHGEAEHNRLGYYSNQDEDLNENGIKQVLELKPKIAKIDYDVCYCPPLLRDRHTAELINHNDRIIVPIDLLSERDPGKLNGMPIEFTDREEYWNYFSKIDDEDVIWNRAICKAIEIVKAGGVDE